MSATAWIADAMCAQTDVSDQVWFPAKGQSATVAQRICLLCPVREACLQYALEHGPVDGIWGGTSVTMRRHLRGAA